MRLFSRCAGCLGAATIAVLVAAMPRLARSTQPGPCPAPRAGVPRWNEAGAVNLHRNLRFSIEAGGVPLVYDSERASVATPYGGAGWALALGKAEVTGSTVVIDEAGVRSTFTESAAGLQGEPLDTRTLVRTGPDGFELRGEGGMVRVFSGGREVALRDRHGVVRSWSYDAQGRLTQIADPRSGDAIALAYSAANRLTTITANGVSQTVSYDEQNRLISISSATTGMPMPVAQVAYGGNGRITSMTNRAGETTTYGYADDGGVDTVRLPDSLSVRTTCERDDAQRLVLRQTDSFGDSVAQVHDADGSVAATWDAYGNQTTYTRDTAHRLTAVTADGRTTQLAWTAAGDLASVTADGRQTTYSYDAAHRVTAVTDALGRTSSYAYDANGLVVRATDGLGRTTQWDRDAAGEVTRVRTPDGLATSYTRDGLGRVTSVVAPDGKTTAYAYTATGDLSDASYPDGTAEHWSYGSDGRMLAHTDRRGDTVSVTYDAENRPSAVSLPGGRSVDVAYDAAGRVTQRNLRLGPNTKSDTVTYGMYGDVATRSINGILSQAAPRMHVPLMPFMSGAGSGSSGMPGPGPAPDTGSGSASVPGSGSGTITITPGL